MNTDREALLQVIYDTTERAGGTWADIGADDIVDALLTAGIRRIDSTPDWFEKSGHIPSRSAKPTVRAASYLSPPDVHRLNWACMPITDAFGTPPYLVGSVLTRPDYRDIDLRLILPDDDVAAMAPAVRLLLNIALSDLVARSANMRAPIDFQIQSMSEANIPEHGMRNPMGVDRSPSPAADQATERSTAFDPAPSAPAPAVDLEVLIQRGAVALHESMCPCGWGIQMCRRRDAADYLEWTDAVLATPEIDALLTVAGVRGSSGDGGEQGG